MDCCCAVDALCEVSAIDTLLSNFIRPLQGEAIATVRRDPGTAQPLLDAQVCKCLQISQKSTHVTLFCSQECMTLVK